VNEIFPIAFMVDNQCIWLAWVNVDEPLDSFIKKNGSPVFSYTREDLLEKCIEVLAEFSVMEASTFDVDDFIRRLSGGASVDCDELINLWNVLLDLESSLGVAKEDSALFSADSMGAYDRFFSGTAAARMIGLSVESISASDFTRAKDVIVYGKNMVLSVAL
jgi:hypothetical protein